MEREMKVKLYQVFITKSNWKEKKTQKINKVEMKILQQG